MKWNSGGKQVADKFLSVLKLCSRGLSPGYFLTFFNLGIDLNSIYVYTLIKERGSTRWIFW